MRSLVGELISDQSRPVIVDIEAGLEHLSRGTARHVDSLLVVVEPYFKSLETGARIHALGQELGISRVLTVANKCREKEDSETIGEFCRLRQMELVAAIPEDPCVRAAERRAVSPLDHDASSPALLEIIKLADFLTNGYDA